MSRPVPRGGVVAIGSNSTRMLTADLDARLGRPVRGRQETRLFLSLENGSLRPDAVRRVREAVAILHRQALDAGAQRVLLTATSAVRDAGDARPLAEALRADTGLRLRVLSGAKEAAWAFLGACWPFGEGERLGVVDIGGGSTEIALGTRERMRSASSLQLGASRLYGTHPVEGIESMEGAVSQARRLMEGVSPDPDFRPARWLLVGGTGMALIGLLSGRPTHSGDMADQAFTREQALRVLERLAPLAPGERANLPGMTPGREHILPTGLAVLVALMDRLGVDGMTVTARNNTDGCLYEWARRQAGKAQKKTAPESPRE